MNSAEIMGQKIESAFGLSENNYLYKYSIYIKKPKRFFMFNPL